MTYDWGLDLPEHVETASAMSTTVFRLQSRDHGLLGEFLEVFVSRKGTVSVPVADQTGAWRGQSTRSMRCRKRSASCRTRSRCCPARLRRVV